MLNSSALDAGLLFADLADELGAGLGREIRVLEPVRLASFGAGVFGSGANAICGVVELLLVLVSTTVSLGSTAAVFAIAVDSFDSTATGSGEDIVRSSTMAPPITVAVITPSAMPK